MGQIQFRSVRAADARLHADSWRRHYGRSYSDFYLDGDVVADWLAVWSERLAEPDSGRPTVLAESGDLLVGFIHTVLSDHPEWGALVDNLHVTSRPSAPASAPGGPERRAVELRYAWADLSELVAPLAAAGLSAG